jgi:hypothetical protein
MLGRRMEQKFDIHYSPRLQWLFVIMGMGPKRSSVVLTHSSLRVRMGPWFALEVPRSSIVAATRHRNVWWSIGVHTDFHKTWLVNGASTGIVILHVSPEATGRSMGFTAHVLRLGLGLEDPEGFLLALGVPQPAPTDAPQTPAF